jgi:hypothetical protein
MPRRPRNPADECICHVLNRGNGRMDLFGKPGDLAGFVNDAGPSRRKRGSLLRMALPEAVSGEGY